MARKIFCIVVTLVCCWSFAWSWGGPTHKFINMQAMKHLPPSCPFFSNNAQWISDHAVDADNRKSTDPTEAPKHFIDIENYPEFAARTLSHNYDTLVAKHGLCSLQPIWGIMSAMLISPFMSLQTTMEGKPATTEFTADTSRRCLQRIVI